MPFFLTDVAMIGAATMGTILLLARIGDAVSIPLSGAVIQTFQPKLGRFRTWLLVAPPITALFFILMFTDLHFSPTTKAVFLGFCYIAAHASINFFQLRSYGADIRARQNLPGAGGLVSTQIPIRISRKYRFQSGGHSPCRPVRPGGPGAGIFCIVPPFLPFSRLPATGCCSRSANPMTCQCPSPPPALAGPNYR